MIFSGNCAQVGQMERDSCWGLERFLRHGAQSSVTSCTCFAVIILHRKLVISFFFGHVRLIAKRTYYLRHVLPSVRTRKLARLPLDGCTQNMTLGTS